MTTQKPELADCIIAFMNECAERDPRAVIALVEARVPCNRSLAEHPTVQCGTDTPDGPFTVGVLGILNGLCGVIPEGPKAGWGLITATLDREAGTIRFERTSEEP